MVEVPGGVQVSFISSFNSRQPFQPIITGTDFYGTGMDQFLLPGSGTNQFNFGLGKGDLVESGEPVQPDLRREEGARIRRRSSRRSHCRRTSKPDDIFNSQDLRVTKLFRFRERLEWQVFGEVFNVFNHANLSGYADNLLAPGLRTAHQPLQQYLRHRRPAELPAGHADFVLEVLAPQWREAGGLGNPLQDSILPHSQSVARVNAIAGVLKHLVEFRVHHASDTHPPTCDKAPQPADLHLEQLVLLGLPRRALRRICDSSGLAGAQR